MNAIMSICGRKHIKVSEKSLIMGQPLKSEASVLLFHSPPILQHRYAMIASIPLSTPVKSTVKI